MKRIRILVVALALLLGACTGDGDTDVSTDDWESVAPEQAPWTIKVPPGWSASTDEFEPGPMGMVGGIVTTTVATSRLRLGGDAPAPHSKGGATDELGEDGAVVLAQRIWNLNEDDPWNPRPGGELIRRSPSRWNRDFQNPGWVSRERKICVGDECVSVLEWHGPEATEDDIERMSLIASSVRLATN